LSSSRKLVSTSTRVAGVASRRRSIAATPSSSGMTRSTSTTTDLAPVRAAQHVDVLGERDGQPLGLDRVRAQVDDHRAQLLHRLPRQLAHL